MTELSFNLDGGRTWDSPSIDRIDPSGGYTYDNIRIVCHAINCALGTWGEEILGMVTRAWMEHR